MSISVIRSGKIQKHPACDQESGGDLIFQQKRSHKMMQLLDYLVVS